MSDIQSVGAIIGVIVALLLERAPVLETWFESRSPGSKQLISIGLTALLSFGSGLALSLENGVPLDWDTLLQVFLGMASGLVAKEVTHQSTKSI